MPFTPITEAAGALQAAAKRCRRKYMTLTIRLTILAYASKQGIQSERCYSRRGVFFQKRKYSGCVTEDGQALLLVPPSLCLVPKAVDVIASSDTFASIERVLVACSIDGFDQNDTFRELSFPRLRSAGIQIRDAAKTIAYFLEQALTCVISRAMTALVPSPAIAERAGVPHML